IGEWLKKPGDQVKLDEPIASLETDKVAIEVPAPVAGVMGEQKVAVGDTVEVGAVIALIEDTSAAGETTQVKPREEAQPADQKAPAAAAPAPAPAPAASDDSATTLPPAARRAVLEHGTDPTQIKSTGKDARLTKEDVLAAAKAKQDSPAPSVSEPAPAAPAPAAAPAATGERREERVKMTRMRQTIARRLKGAQEEAALLTTFNDADMT